MPLFLNKQTGVLGNIKGKYNRARATATHLMSELTHLIAYNQELNYLTGSLKSLLMLLMTEAARIFCKQLGDIKCSRHIRKLHSFGSLGMVPESRRNCREGHQKLQFPKQRFSLAPHNIFGGGGD